MWGIEGIAKLAGSSALKRLARYSGMCAISLTLVELAKADTFVQLHKPDNEGVCFSVLLAYRDHHIATLECSFLRYQPSCIAPPLLL